MTDPHSPERLEQAIANDLRTNELGIRVQVEGTRVIVRGEVASAERRDAVLAVVHEQMPRADIVDHLRLSDAAEPPDDSELVDPS